MGSSPTFGAYFWQIREWDFFPRQIMCTMNHKTQDDMKLNVLVKLLFNGVNKKDAPNVGLEPTTLGLRVPCSTD